MIKSHIDLHTPIEVKSSTPDRNLCAGERKNDLSVES